MPSYSLWELYCYCPIGCIDTQCYAILELLLAIDKMLRELTDSLRFCGQKDIFQAWSAATQATYYNLVLDCVTVLLLVTLYYLCTNSSKRLNGLNFSSCQHATKYGPIQWNSSIFPVSTFYKHFLIFNGQKKSSCVSSEL